MMEGKLRQRIIGAVVIVALAVIFLPLLLKGSNNTAPETKQTTVSAQIPPAPAKPTPAPQAIVMIQNKDLNAPNSATTIPPTNTASSVQTANQPTSTVSQTNNLASSENTANNINAIEDHTLSPPTAKQKTDHITNHSSQIAVPKTTSKITTVNSAPKKAVNKTSVTKKHSEKNHHAETTKPEEVAHKKSAQTPVALISAPSAAEVPAGVAWVVRLGSFANESNAKDLIKQLHEHGFKAYTQPVKTSLGTLTRVFMGPEVKRVKADAINERLEKELKIKGEVVPFSPVTENK